MARLQSDPHINVKMWRAGDIKPPKMFHQLLYFCGLHRVAQRLEQIETKMIFILMVLKF